MTPHWQRRAVVKKTIREWADEEDEDVYPGTGAYADLMQNVEHQVQNVLEEMGEIQR